MRCPALLPDQVLIPQPLIHQSPRHALHLHDSIKRALIEAPRKFVDIPAQVLLAHLVVRPNIASLKQRPGLKTQV